MKLLFVATFALTGIANVSAYGTTAAGGLCADNNACVEAAYCDEADGTGHCEARKAAGEACGDADVAGWYFAQSHACVAQHWCNSGTCEEGAVVNQPCPAPAGDLEQHFSCKNGYCAKSEGSAACEFGDSGCVCKALVAAGEACEVDVQCQHSAQANGDLDNSVWNIGQECHIKDGAGVCQNTLEEFLEDVGTAIGTIIIAVIAGLVGLIVCIVVLCVCVCKKK